MQIHDVQTKDGRRLRVWVGPQGCNHLEQIDDVEPGSVGCEECLRLDERWVHLRICLTCGHVGCCDTSKNKHATKHAHATGHPIVRSMEPGETWMYCYPDDMVMEPVED